MMRLTVYKWVGLCGMVGRFWKSGGNCVSKMIYPTTCWLDFLFFGKDTSTARNHATENYFTPASKGCGDASCCQLNAYMRPHPRRDKMTKETRPMKCYAKYIYSRLPSHYLATAYSFRKVESQLTISMML